MKAQYPIRESTSAARITRRWEIWRSAAPLFEREGYRGVSIEQVAHASALSPGGLYHYFPGKAAIALFPLSHVNGLCRRWHAIAAALPRDPFVRLHALIGFAVQFADPWRLALDLAGQMSADPLTAGPAARLLAEARRDFAEIAESVDPTITLTDVGDLYEAFVGILVTDLPGFDRSSDSLRRRLTDAVRGWLTRRGADPQQFDRAGWGVSHTDYELTPTSTGAGTALAGPL
jgi:AcrR family transcriptional regulator